MKWDIQAVGFDATQELQDTVQEKVSALTKYFEHIVGAEVYLKLDYNDKGDNKVAEIKLNIPGNDLIASSRSDNFNHSINETLEKLKRQISKLKTKMARH